MNLLIKVPSKNLKSEIIDVEEILLRKVKRNGNGGFVYVRKDDMGREVFVIIPRKKKRR